MLANKRKMAGLAAWLETNTDRGTGGADGGYNEGTGFVVAATDGTQRAFARGQLDGVIRKLLCQWCRSYRPSGRAEKQAGFLWFCWDFGIALQCGG